MPIYYAYNQTILGTQSTINGPAFDYNESVPTGGSWSYSRSVFTHVAKEANVTAVIYNGNTTNEFVDANNRIGQPGAQTIEVSGTDRQVLLELVFTVTDGVNTYQIGIIDVDLNNNNEITGAEDGYYIIFIGDVPPPNTNLSIVGIASNNAAYPHAGLGGVPVCFASGTLILTSRGEMPVEELVVGDLVATRDADFQPIRWIGGKRLDAITLAAMPQLRPIRIRAGALGRNSPTADLLVSPQHRILVRSKIAQRLFGANEVLVAAKQLLLIDGIDVAQDVAEVEYVHFLFDEHQVVISNGAETESLYTGLEALRSVGHAAREEIFAIFPELRDRDPQERPEGARRLLTGCQGRKLAHHHAQNMRPLN